MSWDETVDVVVVGGGPGGATTAALLAMRGRKVIVLEEASFPRFHIGESLLPSSAPVLAMLGLTAEMDRLFVRKYGAEFLDDARPPTDPHARAAYLFSEAFAPATPHAWQVTRAELDELLLRRAEALGADVREGFRVTSVVREEGFVVGVRGTGPGGKEIAIGARVVVDASGRDALLSPKQNRRRVPGLDKTAFFSHIQGGHRNSGIEAGHIEITILAGEPARGWAWFIPFGDGRSSIGFVLDSEAIGSRFKGDQAPDRLERFFDEEVARSPWMQRLIGAAPRVAPVRSAADYSFRVTELAGDGWLAVGDAAGFLDPLFSTGAHLAFGGGVRAAEAIDDALAADDVSAARFLRYATTLRSAADLFLGAVQSFYRGDLRSLLFAKDQRSTLRQMITTMLAGDVFHEPEGALWVGYFRGRFPAI